MGILERESIPKEARKCSVTQGPHSEVVPRAFWRLVSKSCDECKGSFARGCEVKRWSHWTCSSLGTIFQPMRINSVPDVKCFCSNKNLLCVQSTAWHFVRHPVYSLPPQSQTYVINYRLMHPDQKLRLYDGRDDPSYCWHHCPRDCAVLVQHTA